MVDQIHTRSIKSYVWTQITSVLYSIWYNNQTNIMNEYITFLPSALLEVITRKQLLKKPDTRPDTQPDTLPDIRLDIRPDTLFFL